MPRNRIHCIVPECLNARSNKITSFFSLPMDEERRKVWLKVINRLDLLEKNDLKPKSYVVCSDHFEERMMLQLPQLRPDAIPTKNVPDMLIPIIKVEFEDGTSEANVSEGNDVSTRKGTGNRKVRKYCSVYGCGSCDDNQSNRQLSFFSLPADEERRNAWLQNIGRTDLMEKSHLKPKSHVVCSTHFETDMIVPLLKLNLDALPTKKIADNSGFPASADVSTQTDSKSNHSETQSGSHSVKTRKRARN